MSFNYNEVLESNLGCLKGQILEMENQASPITASMRSISPQLPSTDWNETTSGCGEERQSC